MQIRQLSFALSISLTLCMWRATQAQQAGQIESIEIVDS